MQKRMRVNPVFQNPSEGINWGGRISSDSFTANERHAYSEAQVTSSESHPYRLLGKVLRDIGGPFETRKISSDLDWSVHNLWHDIPSLDWNWFYNGPILPSSRLFSATVPLSFSREGVTTNELVASEDVEYHLDNRAKVPEYTSSSELDAWGSSVIASVLPTNPVADSATFVAELIAERKLFSVPGTAGSLPGEYLNYMFGIAPTVGMVKDLRTAMGDAEKILHQYSRDSGRLVRRRYEPPPSKTVVNTVQERVNPAGFGPLDSRLVSPGRLQQKTTTYRKLWFSGAFTYYLPKEGLGRTLEELDKLYGVVPDASIAWELLPFSWLVDYKLSLGSVLKNLSAFSQDGLVMPYAYVMCHEKHVVEDVWTGALRYNNTWRPVTLKGSVTLESKQRRPANPFGFGILPEDLTSRQLSIIAALGLTLRR